MARRPPLLRPLSIYYSIVDRYPPHRVDIVELFMIQLASRGLTTSWFLKRWGDGRCSKVKFQEQEISLPWFKSKHRLLNKLAYWLCDFAAIVRDSKNSDIVQVRDKYLSFAVALVCARVRGQLLTYWLSYPWPEHDLEMSKLSKGIARHTYYLRSILGYYWLYKIAFRLADHVFVQSDQMRNDIEGYGIPANKMTPVPMGVPSRLFEWINAQSNLRVESGKVVYVGTFARVRHLATLIEAFHLVWQQCPRAKLYMVGAGDTPSEQAELELMCRRLHLADSIVFTGFLPMEDAWRHAATAEVCVSPIFPSPVLRVGSPTKLYEYLALGRPVVANDHPEQAAVLAETQAGLCVAWSASAFADGICRLLDQPELADAMGKRGPGWVRANRTYDQLAAKVHARYQDLLKSHE